MVDIPAPHGYRRFYCAQCGTPNDVPIHCCSKFCEPCTSARRYRIRYKVQYALKYMHRDPNHRWRHFTLTVRDTHNLDDRLNHLIRSFRKLRQRRIWKESQLLGFYVIEITHTSFGWHPHLHIISYGAYLHWKPLLATWKRITIDSSHIYITPIDNDAAISYYVAKHITKPIDIPQSMHNHLDECTKHRRLFGPFGLAAEILRQHKPPPLRTPCPKCGSYDWIPEFIIERLKKWTKADARPPPQHLNAHRR